MQFPSLDLLVRESQRTIARFPLSIVVACAGAVAVIAEVEDVRFVVVTILGISWFLAVDLLAEGVGWNGVKKLGLRFVALVLLGLYASTLPSKNINDVESIRYSLYISGSHFLVAFALFVRSGTLGAFWGFNKTLFIRFLTSALFSGVLYAGLALAILAIDKLFNADVDEQLYLDLFALIAGPFATIFFLSGVPLLEELPEDVTAYPRGLKIFSQYVLLPIIAVYFVILYLYMGKIAVNWEWPIGWVSSLVLGFSITGMLSFLLLYPIRDDEGNRWVRNFARWFYYGILPLGALLLLAIGRRIDDYGFTEERYIVLLLGIWLLCISIYFLLSRRDNIKVIPISLGIASFLISFGPWGAFAVSTQSQISQLERVMTENGMLVNGTYHNNPMVGYKAATSIRSIIYFLGSHNSLDEVAQWFPTAKPPLSSDALLVVMGLDINRGSSSENGKGYFRERTFQAMSERSLMNIHGFDYLVHINEINIATEISIDGVEWLFVLDSSKQNLKVLRAEVLVATVPIEPTIRRLSDSVGTIEPGWGLSEYYYTFKETENPAIVINSAAGTMRFRLIFTMLNFHIDSTQFEVRSGIGQILLSTGTSIGSGSSQPVPQAPSGGATPP